MASIETVKQKNSTRYVVRFRRFGAAHKISLDSDYTRRDAERLRDAVTAALRAEKLGEPLDRATNLYFDNAPPDLRRRLIAANILCGDKSSLTIQEAFTRFLRERRAVLKPRSAENYMYAYKILSAQLGDNYILDAVRRDDIVALVETMRNTYKASTVRTNLTRCRAFFNWCVKAGLLDKSPVEGFTAGAVTPCKKFYVPAADVLKCFPFLNLERQAILALWRFAGLRANEPTFLTRECVDLARGRLTVFSPKTERHKGFSQRVVPITPQLQKILSEYLDATIGAPTDKLFGVQLHSEVLDLARKKAGVFWPRAAQSLRISCENDWLEARIPAHVVASWIGHSVDVQTRHYAVVLDSYFSGVTKIKEDMA